MGGYQEERLKLGRRKGGCRGGQAGRPAVSHLLACSWSFLLVELHWLDRRLSQTGRQAGVISLVAVLGGPSRGDRANFPPIAARNLRVC